MHHVSFILKFIWIRFENLNIFPYFANLTRAYFRLHCLAFKSTIIIIAILSGIAIVSLIVFLIFYVLRSKIKRSPLKIEETIQLNSVPPLFMQQLRGNNKPEFMPSDLVIGLELSKRYDTSMHFATFASV